MQRRRGFTLVEMLVVVALTLFIMTILSQAFIAGLESFRQLKAIGDMQAGLRMAATQLQADLLADHFEGPRKMSDSTWNTQGPPTEGYFLLRQDSLSYLEGVDGDFLPCYRATNHSLFVYIRLRGSRKESFLSANVPANSPLLNYPAVSTMPGNPPPDSRFQDTPGTYNSNCAEVGYFLVLAGGTVDPSDATKGGTPLYTLYRLQRAVVGDRTQLNMWPPPGNPMLPPVPANQASSYTEMSCQQPDPPNTTPRDPSNGSILLFNSPGDLANGYRSANAYGPINLSTMPGASPLLLNVISFQVQVMFRGSATFVDLPQQPNGAPAIYDSRFPQNNNIVAVQITFRVYDPATQQSRQMTLIQDM